MRARNKTAASFIAFAIIAAGSTVCTATEALKAACDKYAANGSNIAGNYEAHLFHIGDSSSPVRLLAVRQRPN